MPEGTRSYDASGRRAQARARRRAVVAAAQELFEKNGFRATTISAVAQLAGVSAESIYKGFGSKAALAKAVFDVVIAGDDEEIPIAERAEIAAVRAERDVRRKIALYVDGLSRRMERSSSVQILIRDGRHVDDSLGPTWQQLQDEGITGMGMLGGHLLETGQLRADLTADEVRDVLWNYIAVDHYERLVLQRHWSLESYASWLTRALTSALCDETT
jgi:AcrR family transcriptional regulator